MTLGTDRIHAYRQALKGCGKQVDDARAAASAEQRLTTVVHLASGDLWAGAEVQLFHLACALQKDADVRLYVVLLNDGSLAQRLKENGVSVHVLDEQKLNALQILHRLVALLRRYRPDVVHTHRVKENIIGAIAARLVGARSVRTVHGAKEFPPGPWQLRRRLHSALDFMCARHLQERVVAVSSELAGRLACQLPGARIAVVENGLDIDKLRDEAAHPVTIPGPSDTVRIAFVARLVPVKRIDVFLGAAELLASQHPGIFSFYVIGDGPEINEARIRALCSGFGDSIFFLGFKAAVAPYLARMHLLYITSDHEGLPMNLLEALALECPVVAHGVGGIPRVLDDGRAGTLIRSQSIQPYVEAGNAYIRDAAPFLEKARHGLERVRACYSARSNAAAYKAIYETGVHMRTASATQER